MNDLLPPRDATGPIRRAVNGAFSAALGCGGCLFILAYVVTLYGAGRSFFVDYWGWHWIAAVLVMTVGLMAFPAVVVIAGFLGAWLVWEWPFLAALALAAPGLVLMVSAMAVGVPLAVMAEIIRRVRSRWGG